MIVKITLVRMSISSGNLKIRVRISQVYKRLDGVGDMIAQYRFSKYPVDKINYATFRAYFKEPSS